MEQVNVGACTSTTKSSCNRENIKSAEDLIDFLLQIENSQLAKLAYDDKLFIVRILKRPQPLMTNLLINAKHNRSFNVEWYKKCDWLTGSQLRNKLFCWNCVLFSTDTENTVWSKSGYNDLKNLPRSIERHGRSKPHLAASIKLKLYGKHNVINAVNQGHKQTIIDFNNKVKENRDIMKRLIDTVIFLCCQDLAFRGHREDADSDNRGNFQELVTFLSKYDTKLQEFLNEATVFAGTSKSIQNDLIESVSSVVVKKIETELLSVPFFSWQIDETTDITCCSQLSVIFRYVFNGEVVERFAGFYDVSSGRTANDLFNFVIDKFSKFDLKNKLVAQTYDGASVMAGHLNGLQAKIKTVAPNAIFTHCYAHTLNLILSKACMGSIRDCRIFFSNLSGFSAFFSKSTKRTDVLNLVGSAHIPSNAASRWNFTSRSVFTVFSNKNKLIEVFDHILSHDDFKHDQQTLRESIGLKNFLTDPHFIFLLHTFNFIFNHTDVVFSILQNKSTDIAYAKKRLISLVNTLQDFRSNEIHFNDLYNKFFEDEESLPKKRKTTLNVPDLKQNYKQLFVEIIDTIINQLNIRFSDLNKLEFFDLIKTENFQSYTKDFPETLFESLLKLYSVFDRIALKNELITIYSDTELFPGSQTPTEMISFIYNNDLLSCLPEFYKLLTIIVTIPVTSASVERSFSALKRIKIFTRNSIGQSRLKNISIISIEKHLVKQLSSQNTFYDEVIDMFAEQKNRRIPLIYKNI